MTEQKPDPPAREYVCPACSRAFASLAARAAHYGKAHPELVFR